MWRFLGALLVVLQFGAIARASRVLEILIVDPGDTETGRRCQTIAHAFGSALVKRVQLNGVNDALRSPPNVVVWLDPEPSLYESIKPQWEKMLASKSVGLMFIGLPDDQAGKERLVAALKERGGPQIGVHLSRHLEGCHWIWTQGKTSDSSHAYLRKRVDLKQLPARAWIQVAADNRARVFVNGKEAGLSEEWRRPSSFDVKSLLHEGNNVVAVDAYNEDGPAGVVLSLDGWSASGEVVLEIKSDATWTSSDAPAENWQLPGFDDSSWKNARAIAVLGEGPWETKVRSDYVSDEYLTSFASGKHEAIDKLDGPLGQIVMLNALKPGGGCTTILKSDDIPIAVAGEGSGGRMILVGGSFERTTPFPGKLDVLDTWGFKEFLGHSMAWLARTGVPDIRRIAKEPGTAPPLNIDPLKPEDREKFFPVAMQFTPLPHDGLPDPDSFPTRQRTLRRMIDNMIDHGVTTLQVPVQLPPEQARDIEDYAQSRGMTIAAWWFERSAEVFNRKETPPVSPGSREYQQLVRQRVSQNMERIARFPRLQTVWTFQDEPFHQGPKSFDFSDAAKSEFVKRFQYEMPTSVEVAKTRPRHWLDFLNFQSDCWPIGWREAYKVIKEANPNFIAAANHDSHNTFGGAVQQEGVYNVDDVFHWGGDWADMYSFDIYPYLMSDFRYGPNRKLKLPRMSQTHFAFAQMRNLTTTFNKKLGFWVGTYNPEWYDLPKEGRAQYWMEREMAYTALANGANFLIGGIGIPIDQHHWDNFGQSMKTLAKVGPELLKAPKIRARAAMLFPRTQTLLTQEEYWNVAQSYEAFLRAFGELDVIHEDQILSGDNLKEYQILVLFDVKLLPAKVAGAIANFVDSGGMVIADCVPQLDENRQPLETMKRLFGVSEAQTDRILWKIRKKKDDPEVDDPKSLEPATRPTVALRGNAVGREQVDISIVSPRRCVVTDAQVLVKAANDEPGLIESKRGRGRTYLLGFCLQDTLFQAWETADRSTIQEIHRLLDAITLDADVHAHVHSSNGDIEAAVRANQSEGFVLVVAHEPVQPQTSVRLRDLPFGVAKVIDVESDQEIPLTRASDGFAMNLNVPNGATRILRLVPAR